MTVFVFVKEFEKSGLRSIDAKNFGRIVKKCLGLPKTVRQCDLSLSVSYTLSDSLISVSHYFAIKEKHVQLHDSFTISVVVLHSFVL